jgi:ferredoxin-like protein FixX
MNDTAVKTKATIDFNIKDMVFRKEGQNTGDFITYNEGKCNGCGKCTMVCSVNLWAMASDKKKARLSPKYKELCMECAACDETCEADAISFRYPDGGYGIIIKHG